MQTILMLLIMIVVLAIVYLQTNRKHIPPKFTLLENEFIIFESNTAWLKSRFNNKMGRIYLTNRRLVFSVNTMFYFYIFGLLGFLFSKLTSKNPAIELQNDMLQSIQQTKYGINNKIIDITDKNGNIYRLSFMKKHFECWITELQKYCILLPPNI